MSEFACFLCSKDSDLKWNQDSLYLIRELKLCKRHSEIVEAGIAKFEQKTGEKQHASDREPGMEG